MHWFPRFPAVPGTARPAIGSRFPTYRWEPQPEPIKASCSMAYRFPDGGARPLRRSAFPGTGVLRPSTEAQRAGPQTSGTGGRTTGRAR
jgi:hypothetical protein